MKLSCAFSIAVLFVTGLNIPLVAKSTSSSTSSSTKATAANTAASSASTTTTAANTTAASTSTTTTSQTTTAGKYECISFTCNGTGCLTNASNPRNCTGEFCKIEQRFTVNQTSYNIIAGCANSCTPKDETVGNSTVRTRCCQSLKCNNDDTKIAPLLAKTGGSTSNQIPLWILSIMMFISAFEILL